MAFCVCTHNMLGFLLWYSFHNRPDNQQGKCEFSNWGLIACEYLPIISPVHSQIFLWISVINLVFECGCEIRCLTQEACLPQRYMRCECEVCDWVHFMDTLCDVCLQRGGVLFHCACAGVCRRSLCGSLFLSFFFFWELGDVAPWEDCIFPWAPSFDFALWFFCILPSPFHIHSSHVSFIDELVISYVHLNLHDGMKRSELNVHKLYWTYLRVLLRS